jgi:hypothetical protein
MVGRRRDRGLHTKLFLRDLQTRTNCKDHAFGLGELLVKAFPKLCFHRKSVYYSYP